MSGAWRLRGYVIERLLGRGASGEVWQARVAGSGDPVALKRIVVLDEVQAGRAEAEAALLTALDHPHLVRLHAVVPADDATVLVLDLADGGSLAELLAARGRLTAGEVITAVAPIAAGLAYLHDEGVVHGDVSAANILFTQGGSPLLADVGVARLTGDDRDAASTPAYVDPAVAAGCVPGPQSDVFMLAGVALHALTGEPPWPAESGAAALALAAQGGLDDVDERMARADVPPAMAAVLRRALAVDPHRRGTAADLALDLRHSGEPVAVELAAGRERPDPVVVAQSGPRHAARPAGLRLPDRPPDDGARVAAPSRPPFERPAGSATARGGAPPTRLVGPRPRPVIPRPRRRGNRRRALVIALAVVSGILLAAAGTVWATTGERSRPTPAATNRFATPGQRTASSSAPAPSAPTTPTRATSAPTTPTRATSAPAPTTPTRTTPSRSVVADPAVTDWRTALPALDAIRSRAFRTRDTRLLARVYVPGPLLAADAALLRRIVPAGCGLSGVRTSYRGVHAAVHGAHVTVTATATLASSRLVCDGQVSGTAPGTGPDRLRVVLARTASGLRIAELHT